MRFEADPRALRAAALPRQGALSFSAASGIPIFHQPDKKATP
jgi:hypothetical protein